MYNQVYFEISGYCNARCPWCVQGRGALIPYPSRFIPPQEFRDAIFRLIDEALINSDTIINLYNFGEPFLHPSLQEILQVLSDYNLKYVLATNSSKFVQIDPNLLKNLHRLFISMPGFSQNSYDKIHGFDFKEILTNIGKWIKLLGPERIQIQYHIYQFNLDEIEKASEFFKKRGVNFFPYCALIADYNFAKSFLDNTLPREVSERISDELVLSYLPGYLTMLPENYSCPQHSILAIDEYCNVLTCCLLSKADPDYSIGSLFNLSSEEIEQKKTSRKTCKICIGKGIAFWIHNVYCPEFVQDIQAGRTS